MRALLLTLAALLVVPTAAPAAGWRTAELGELDCCPTVDPQLHPRGFLPGTVATVTAWSADGDGAPGLYAGGLTGGGARGPFRALAASGPEVDGTSVIDASARFAGVDAAGRLTALYDGDGGFVTFGGAAGALSPVARVAADVTGAGVAFAANAAGAAVAQAGRDVLVRAADGTWSAPVRAWDGGELLGGDVAIDRAGAAVAVAVDARGTHARTVAPDGTLGTPVRLGPQAARGTLVVDGAADGSVAVAWRDARGRLHTAFRGPGDPLTAGRMRGVVGSCGPAAGPVVAAGDASGVAAWAARTRRGCRIVTAGLGAGSAPRTAVTTRAPVRALALARGTSGATVLAWAASRSTRGHEHRPTPVLAAVRRRGAARFGAAARLGTAQRGHLHWLAATVLDAGRPVVAWAFGSCGDCGDGEVFRAAIGPSS